MEHQHIVPALLYIGLVISVAIAASVNVSKGFDTDKTPAGPGHVLVCYVSSWATYRPGRGAFDLDDIDPSLCTHLVYAFAGLNASTNSLRSLDPYRDLDEDYGKGSYKKMTALRDRQPGLKVTLAVGGWNEGSANYSLMASTREGRSRFVDSAVQFLQKYEFDGLDLDWEFPAKRGGKPEDKENFVLLVKELRAAFDPRGWLLTAALGAGPDTILAAYDVVQLSEHLHLLHAMCYDYHGAWDKRTGANTPLPRQEDNFSVTDSIELLLSLGASPSKLVLGLSMYGRTFVTTAPATSGLGNDAAAAGFQGPFTREDGFLGYNEICKELGGPESGWLQSWDNASETPYAVNGNRVITYDDPRSIASKVSFAMSKGLAGLMVWALDNDDFHGDCADGKRYPLLKAIHSAVAASRHEQKPTDKPASAAVSLSLSCGLLLLSLFLSS